MSAEDNLQPRQFKWTPHKFDLRVGDHLLKEHGRYKEGGWSRTYIDERSHAAEHDADPEGIAGTIPHKHFTPKNRR